MIVSSSARASHWGTDVDHQVHETRPAEGLITPRLRLTPCPLEVARASLRHPATVQASLGVEVPATWPPSDLLDALTMYARDLSRDPSHLGWGIWLVIARTEGKLVGSVGFKGKPDRDRRVEIGYGIEPASRRRGYATEAVAALLSHAWECGVHKIVAECHPDNAASIRVLTKSGMRRTESGGPMLWWELCTPT